MQVAAERGAADRGEGTRVPCLALDVAEAVPQAWGADGVPEVAVAGRADQVQVLTEAGTAQAGEGATVRPGLALDVAEAVPAPIRVADGVPQVAVAGRATDVQVAPRRRWRSRPR
jgi:hypothetical protein